MLPLNLNNNPGCAVRGVDIDKLLFFIIINICIKNYLTIKEDIYGKGKV